MGWNQGYTILEQTIIGTYNIGKLDKQLLSVLLEPYRNTDIDQGGSRKLKSDDGRTVEQIVIETWGLTFPEKPMDEDSLEFDDYRDEVYTLFSEVTQHFGW